MSLRLFILILFNVVVTSLVSSKGYNNGLVFYNLKSKQFILPPAVSFVRSRGVQSVFAGSLWSRFGPPCTCDRKGCNCCAGLKVQEHSFDEKICANITYNSDYDEARMNVFLSDTNVAKYGVSARNPSPLCMPIMMPIPMSMCIQMSNVGLQGDNLHMCMDFVVMLHTTQLMQMHFNCMKLGADGFQYLNPSGNAVFPMMGKDGKEYDDDEEEEGEAEAEDDGENESENAIYDDDEEEEDHADDEDDKYVRIY